MISQYSYDIYCTNSYVQCAKIRLYNTVLGTPEPRYANESFFVFEAYGFVHSIGVAMLSPSVFHVSCVTNYVGRLLL